MSTPAEQPASATSKKETVLCDVCLLPHNLMSPSVYTCLDAQAGTMKRLLDAIGDHGTCAGCHASIFWVTHRNGKKVPYNSTGVNHFVTCPEAARFKR
jgi:hypothetical protein